MKTSLVLSIWLSTGLFVLCSAQEDSVPVPVPPVQIQSLQVSLTAILPDLSHHDHSRRRDASQALLELAKQSRKDSIPALLKLAAEGEAPEARERVLRTLRELAKADYNTIGEGYCGIQMSLNSNMLDVPKRGALAGISLTFIAADGPAAKAGLKVNDAVVSIDETVWKEPGNQMEDLRKIIRKKGAGNTVKFGIMREGKYQEVAVQLHRRPPNIDSINANQQNLFFRGGFQQVPQFNQSSVDAMQKEDLESEDFFTEWLRKEKELRKHK